MRVKERTGQKREEEETLETDAGQLHMEPGSWKRMQDPQQHIVPVETSFLGLDKTPLSPVGHPSSSS